jgi:hypothetical protein
VEGHIDTNLVMEFNVQQYNTSFDLLTPFLCICTLDTEIPNKIWMYTLVHYILPILKTSPIIPLSGEVRWLVSNCQASRVSIH